MRRTRNAFLALVAVLLSPMAANADPIVLDGECVNTADLCVFGIEGLQVGESILDVNFVSGSFDTIFADESPRYLDDNDGALSAAAAIQEILDGSYFGVIGNGDSDVIFINSILDRARDTTFGAVVGNTSASDWSAGFNQQISPVNIDLSLFAPDIYAAWAVFSNERPISVPEPGTFTLLGAGLIGIGFARRRKKA